MFHLKQLTKAPGKVSISEAGELLRARKFFFEWNRFAPKALKSWLESVKKEWNIFDVAKLKDGIRSKLGYSLAGIGAAEVETMPVRDRFLELQRLLSEVRGKIAALEGGSSGGELAGLEKTEKFLKVELAIALIELAYGGTLRRSGYLRVSHPLRVAFFAATLHVPVDWVASALLHDIREDTRDKWKDGILFRVPLADGTLDVLKTAKRQLEFIREWFGLEVKKDVWLLTRERSKKGDDVRYYRNYLARINHRVSAALIKVLDGISNLWELDFGGKPGEAEQRERTALKAEWQMPFWRKLSWFLNEMLLLGILDIRNYAGEAYRLQRITEKQVDDFEKGYVLAKFKRSLFKKLLLDMPDQGSMVLMAYPQGRGRYLLEMPHLEKPEEARPVLAALGIRLEEAKPDETIFIPFMRKALFLEIKITKKELLERLPSAIEAYDAILFDTILSSIPIQFDRKGWRRQWAGLVREGDCYELHISPATPETPSRGNGGSREGLAQKEPVGGKRVAHHLERPGSGKTGELRPGQFRSKRPL